MLCELSEDCLYYNTYKDDTTSKQHTLLIESYCKGQLQLMCRRKQHEKLFSKVAPNNMAPNGYLVGTNKKLRVDNTRQHKRHEVENATCLLKDIYHNYTFSAEVIDVSMGGLKLVTNVDPHVLGNASEKTILKLIGHTIDEGHIPSTEGFVKVVWQKNQVFGCAFVTQISNS